MELEDSSNRKICRNIDELSSQISQQIFDLNPDKIQDNHKYTFIFTKDLEAQFIVDFSNLENLLYSKVPEEFQDAYKDELEIVLVLDGICFSKGLEFKNTINIGIEFYSCDFKGLFEMSNCVFNKTLSFNRCNFGRIKSSFAVFDHFIDFSICEFREPVNFYKVDFNSIVDFTGSVFLENLLFTFSSINGQVIFNGSQFIKGLDLSLSNLNGDVNVFRMRINDFEAEYFPVDKVEDVNELYVNAVSFDNIIPISNKRETFRIIKHQLVSQNNISESLDFKYLEKETLKRERWIKLREHFKSREAYKSLRSFFGFAELGFDYLNLLLNKCSNSYGKSYIRAFFFIMVVGSLFCWLSLISTDAFRITLNLYSWDIDKGVQYFVQFLMPTHGFNYLGEGVQLSSWFFIWDFIGRVFVSYGIYQFIQAFRKYR